MKVFTYVLFIGKNWSLFSLVCERQLVTLSPLLVFLRSLCKIEIQEVTIATLAMSRKIVTQCCHQIMFIKILISKKKRKKNQRPWLSRIEYFKNNKQNLSSHLELVISKNSPFLFVKITSSIFHNRHTRSFLASFIKVRTI